MDKRKVKVLNVRERKEGEMMLWNIFDPLTWEGAIFVFLLILVITMIAIRPRNQKRRMK